MQTSFSVINNTDITSLEETIIELQSNHTDEIESLEEMILEKDMMINETDSKMSMISVYVDQLEERLASFAVARRDINVREILCKEIEEREIQTSKDYASIQKQMKEISASRDELKNLVDLMTEERQKLSKERDGLIAEKEMFLADESKLRDEVSKLQELIVNLQNEVDTARILVERANVEIEEKEAKLNELYEFNMSSKAKLEQQEENLKDSVACSESLKQEVSRLEQENNKILTLVIALEEKIELLVAELEDKSSTTQRGEVEDIQNDETNDGPFEVSPEGRNGNDVNEDEILSDIEVHDDKVYHDKEDITCNDNLPPQSSEILTLLESGHREGKEAHMQVPIVEQALIPPPPHNFDGTDTDEVTDHDKNILDEISKDNSDLIQSDSNFDDFSERQVNSIQYPPPPPPPLNKVEEPEMNLEQPPISTLEFDGVTGEADFLEDGHIYGHTRGNWEDEISEDDLGDLEQGHIDDGSKEWGDNSIISEISIQGDEESDDFEVISDDDNKQPRGFYEDHFDYKEKLNSINDETQQSDSVELDDEEEDDDEGGQISNDDADEPAFPSSDDEESRDKDLGVESDTILPSHNSVQASNMQEKKSDRRGTVATLSPKGRNVPLRSLRKKFSRLTGVHGLFTPSSKPAFVNQGSKSQ